MDQDQLDRARAAYDPPAIVRTLPSWLLSRAAKRAHEALTDALEAEGAHRQYFSVLAALADSGPTSQADLGRRLWIDRSDLHAIMVDMEGSGLVERAADPEDRRRNTVTITDAGLKLLGKLGARVHEAQDRFLEPLTPEERTRLVELLNRLLGT